MPTLKKYLINLKYKNVHLRDQTVKYFSMHITTLPGITFCNLTSETGYYEKDISLYGFRPFIIYDTIM